MMEIPKILNLYPLDKLRDRKSEGVVQKYTSSFYSHVLEKALCPVFVKDIFSCRTKGASQVFCTCFSRSVLMSDNRDSSKPLACRNAVPISRVLAPYAHTQLIARNATSRPTCPSACLSCTLPATAAAQPLWQPNTKLLSSRTSSPQTAVAAVVKEA